MKNHVLFLALALGLAACATRPVADDPARYGLPDAPAGGNRLLRSVTVSGASWLGTPEMHYRLRYQDDERRHAYASNRWQAAPPELLEHYLGRSLAGVGAVGACRLRVELDEFQQVFDRPDASHALLQARVLLLGQGSGAPLARQAFRLMRPAPSADPRGGARALGQAVDELSQAISHWLAGLPVGQSCQSGD